MINERAVNGLGEFARKLAARQDAGEFDNKPAPAQQPVLSTKLAETLGPRITLRDYENLTIILTSLSQATETAMTHAVLQAAPHRDRAARIADALEVRQHRLQAITDGWTLARKLNKLALR